MTIVIERSKREQRLKALGEITRDAEQIRLSLSLAAIIAAVLIGTGRAAYRLVMILGFIPVWCFAGLRRGWQEASAAEKAKRAEARRVAMIQLRAQQE